MTLQELLSKYVQDVGRARIILAGRNPDPELGEPDDGPIRWYATLERQEYGPGGGWTQVAVLDLSPDGLTIVRVTPEWEARAGMYLAHAAGGYLR